MGWAAGSGVMLLFSRAGRKPEAKVGAFSTKHAPDAIDRLTRRLHSMGWSYGYCAKIDETGTITWLADACKGERWVKANGPTLMQALWKLCHAVQPECQDNAWEWN
jgi:hypothetical protein